MKTKKGFNLRQVGDEHIIMASGAENIDFTNIISLNESAAKLWKEVADKTFTAEDLARLLLEWYEIDEEIAQKDARDLLNDWLKAGIIEE